MKITYKNLKVSAKVDGIETNVSIDQAEIEISCFDFKDIFAGIKDIAKMGIDAQMFNIKKEQEPEREEDYPDIPF